MIHLQNASYIDAESFQIIQTDIWVEEGPEGKVSFSLPAQIPESIEKINCKGLLVTRALTNAHHHIYSALARGMPPPKHTPQNFHEKLQHVWWKLDQALDEEMIRSSALVSALFAAKSGCCFIIDHHSSPSCISGSLDIIADALDKAGTGHLLSYEITDRNGPEKAVEALEETRRYLRNRQGLVGLHAGFTVDDQTLQKAYEIANEFNTGVHVHLAEDKVDQEISLQKYGKRVVVRFADMGLLKLSPSIFVHAIHLDEYERSLLKDSEAYIAVNYDSNLNNKVGIFKGTGLYNNIMLGTDGMHSDMFASARTAWFTGMNHEKLTPQTVYSRLRRVHHYLQSNQFSGDGENNLMIIDYDTPTPVSDDNFSGHFFYGLHFCNVKHLISQGKLIMKNRKHLLLDEKEILSQAREQAEKLWDRLK
jgi:cytosine/adenosine deaminase-related metal-dependent hydrolase